MKMPANAGRGLPGAWLRLAALFAIASLCGCGDGKELVEANSREAQELAALQKANQEVGKLRTENESLDRLQREHEELERLRSVPTDLAKARVANNQLRVLLGMDPVALDPVPTSDESAGVRATTPSKAAIAVANYIATLNPDMPREGDDILIEPSQFGVLMPELRGSWQEGARRAPVSATAMLKERGIVFTNYNQLRQLGITNFSIRRAPPPPDSPLLRAP